MAKNIKWIIIYLILTMFYFIRILFLIPHGVCKFNPSCTEYARQAMMNFPIHKAVYYILKRLMHCNPFSKGGYDPIITGERSE